MIALAALALKALTRLSDAAADRSLAGGGYPRNAWHMSLNVDESLVKESKPT